MTPPSRKPRSCRRPSAIFILSGCGVIALLAGVAWFLPALETDTVARAIGRFGPVAVVFLVALGIVVTPIPSGVVALAAGAVYGTVAGGLLTIAGAVLGAVCAFGLSRRFGRGIVANIDNPAARALTADRSQRGLMVTVFVTRLIPFVSFDAVSYLAGLTPISLWRFALATAAGTAPVCFGFAAAGNGAAHAGMGPVALGVACAVTLVPVAGYALVRMVRKGRGGRAATALTAA